VEDVVTPTLQKRKEREQELIPAVDMHEVDAGSCRRYFARWDKKGEYIKISFKCLELVERRSRNLE